MTYPALIAAATGLTREDEIGQVEEAMRILTPGGTLDHLSRPQFIRRARQAAKALFGAGMTIEQRPAVARIAQ